MKDYVSPEKFEFWKEYGESVGFRYVASGPLVSKFYNCYYFFISQLEEMFAFALLYCLYIGTMAFHRLDHLIGRVSSSLKA